ncbi:MAG: hypothetical protein JO326_10180 [Acetobacteraceae bacterium]|nr:hypothetical protein [Acetobacteraceae bacterium]
MPQRTLARLYDTRDAGEEVVRRLEAAGISHEAISIVSRDGAAEGGRDDVLDQRMLNDPNVPHTMAAPAEPSAAAGTGASVGTLLGGAAGLLAGIGALAIPGVGPVIAAGWLVATITGAGVGAAAGGVAGSLMGAGVHHDEAHVYDQGVRRGGTLVSVHVEENDAARIEEILDAGGPADWRTRGDEYRAGGWTPGATDAGAVIPPAPGLVAPVTEPGVIPPAEGSLFGGPTTDELPRDREQIRRLAD